MPRPLSDDAVPAWVHTALQRWGIAKRRIWLGGYQWSAKDLSTSQGDLKRPDATRFHTDGYSSRSVFAKIRDEREGAGTSRMSQHWAEVMTDDALAVQRALRGMPEKPHAALHLLYVFTRELNVQRKAEWLQCSVRELYGAASRGRVWIHARLEACDAGIAEFDISEIIRDILQKDLRSEIESGKSGGNLELVPVADAHAAPNLQALRRRTLTLRSDTP